MKKLLTIFILFFSIASAQAQDDLCDISRACRKACDLKMENKFNDYDEKHQKLITQCSLDLMKTQNQGQ
jgi:hypothetical protein